MLMGCEDWDFNLHKLRKFRVKVPTATLPLPLACDRVSYGVRHLAVGLPRQIVQREDSVMDKNCWVFFSVIVFQWHFVCWAPPICLMWFETHAGNLSGKWMFNWVIGVLIKPEVVKRKEECMQAHTFLRVKAHQSCILGFQMNQTVFSNSLSCHWHW